MNGLLNALKGRRWVPVVRVLLVALLAQPAVSALLSSSAERYPAVAVIVAAVEGLVGVAATLAPTVTSEPAAPKPPGSAT